MYQSLVDSTNRRRKGRSLVIVLVDEESLLLKYQIFVRLIEKILENVGQ